MGIFCIFSFFWAGEIVLMNGNRIKCEGPYEVKGKFVLYHDADGKLFSLPLKVVNLDLCTHEDVAEEVKVEETTKAPEKVSIFDAAIAAGGRNELSKASLDQEQMEDFALRNAAEKRNNSQARNAYEEFRDEVGRYLSASDLYRSIRNHDQKQLRQCIVSGMDLEKVWSDYPPALHVALDEEWEEGVSMLLKAGASATHQWQNVSPIQVASVADSKETGFRLISQLIAYGASADVVDEEGHSLIFKALEDVDYGKMELFVKNGANVLRADKKGYCALQLAIMKSDEKAFQIMASNLVSFDFYFKDGSSPLIKAIDVGSDEIVPKILARGANPSFPDTSGMTPLIYAYRYDNKDVIKLLKENGGGLPPSARDNYPLCAWLGMFGTTECLLNLVQVENLKLNQLELCALMRQTIASNNAQLVPGMKKIGLDLNSDIKDGDTPLTLSVKADAHDVVKALLVAGANPKKANKDGLLPISLVNGPNAKMIQKLLK